jgi:uncharacterized oxidoreductase
LLNSIKTTPPAPGFEEVLVPGEYEHRSRLKRLAEGIELPTTIYGELQEWADRLAVSLNEELVESSDRQRYSFTPST